MFLKQNSLNTVTDSSTHIGNFWEGYTMCKKNFVLGIVLLMVLPVPESILLGVAFLGIALSISILLFAKEREIQVFRKLCSYFRLLSVCLMVALLRNELMCLGKNYTFAVASMMGHALYDDNCLVSFTIICLFLFSLLYVSKKESLAIGNMAVTEESKKSIKVLAESSNVLYKTARFTVFIHFCFFAVGVLIALFIAQYSVSGTFIEIARK